MSSYGLDQDRASALDFAASFMTGQLESLPGDLRRPDNATWQDATLASIALKVSVLREPSNIDGADAPGNHDHTTPDYETYVKGQLARHASRLEGLGQRVTAATLRQMMPVVESASSATL